MSENAILLFVGKRGTGKSFKLKGIAARSRRMIAIDPEAKWPLLDGDLEVRSARELFGTLRELRAWDPATRWRIVYRDDFSVMKHAGPAAAHAIRNCTFVCDELAWLCKAQSLPDRLARLIQFGRERRINFLATTREPQELPDLFFSQADCRFFFQTDPGNGLDRIRRRYPKIAADLPTLKLHDFRMYGNPKVAHLIGKE